MVLALMKEPLRVVMGPEPDVTVTTVVDGGGTTVVTKCARHSSTPAGFWYIAIGCYQYIFFLHDTSCVFLNFLTSVTLVLDTSGLHAPEHHESSQC